MNLNSSKTRPPLSDNINALGELVAIYGPAHITHTLARIMLDNYELPDEDGQLWVKVLRNAEAYLTNPDIRPMHRTQWGAVTTGR